MPRLSCTRLAVVGQGRGTLRDAILSTALPETLAYIALVEAADEEQLETGVLAEMVEAANWAIPLGGQVIPFLGARTLAGAAVPMVGPAPTLFNYVEGDYSRTTGITGAPTKYMLSNVLSDDLPRDDVSLAIVLQTPPTNQSGIQGSNLVIGQTHAFIRPTEAFFRNRGGGVIDRDYGAVFPQLIGTSRDNADDFDIRVSQETVTQIANSDTPGPDPVYIFSRAASQGTNATAWGHRFGLSIDLAELESRWLTMQTAIITALA